MENNESSLFLDGIDYLVKLSFQEIDRSTLAVSAKRSLLYSLYSFRCLFDERELKRVSRILVKYGCSFLTDEASYNSFENVIKVDDTSHKKTAYKFDVGSPLYIDKVLKGEIDGDFAIMPEKLTLFETAYMCVTLDNASLELKSLWYIYLPFIPLIGAPIEYDLYDRLKEILLNDAIFEGVLESRFGDNILTDIFELGAEHPFFTEWYTPYEEYVSEITAEGISRERKKLHKKIALKEFVYVINYTDAALDVRPFDEDLALINISAKTSFISENNPPEKEKLFAENLEAANTILSGNCTNTLFFKYYRGLAKLGLQDVDGAANDFANCLVENPSFQPATLMLKGIQKAKELKNKDE